MANATGVTYQWLDCDNGNAPIPGATNASYQVTASGNYAVAITQGSCVDTSNCRFVRITTVDQMAKDLPALRLYPNPTAQQVWVDWGQPQTEVSIQVIGLLGEVLLEQQVQNRDKVALPLALPAGVYLIKVVTADGAQQTARVVVTGA